MTATPLRIAAVVFPGFEILDLFGPVELPWMTKEEFAISSVGEKRGEAASAQGARVVVDHAFGEREPSDILLVPGGFGTRVRRWDGAGSRIVHEHRSRFPKP